MNDWTNEWNCIQCCQLNLDDVKTPTWIGFVLLSFWRSFLLPCLNQRVAAHSQRETVLLTWREKGKLLDVRRTTKWCECIQSLLSATCPHADLQERLRRVFKLPWILRSSSNLSLRANITAAVEKAFLSRGYRQRGVWLRSCEWPFITAPWRTSWRTAPQSGTLLPPQQTPRRPRGWETVAAAGIDRGRSLLDLLTSGHCDLSSTNMDNKLKKKPACFLYQSLPWIATQICDASLCVCSSPVVGKLYDSWGTSQKFDRGAGADQYQKEMWRKNRLHVNWEMN